MLVDFDAAFIAVTGALPFLLQGALVTILTVFFSLLLGFLLGLPLAVLQVYGPSYIRKIVSTYVWFFRGVPILVLLFLFYFGLAFQLGLDVSPFAASCLVLGCTSAAYQSQIFRGGLLAVSPGQMKAALALGMSKFLAIRCIVLPQGLRFALPAWTNEFSILLKDSALVSVLGTLDLMSRTTAMATGSGQYATFYIVAALTYFIITWAGVSVLHFVEKRISISRYTQSQADLT